MQISKSLLVVGVLSLSFGCATGPSDVSKEAAPDAATAADDAKLPTKQVTLSVSGMT